ILREYTQDDIFGDYRAGDDAMSRLTCSVLIPSLRRPDQLTECLNALAAQTCAPEQIIVVWQADDTPTRDLAGSMTKLFDNRLMVLRSEVAGVVPAENVALAHATGEIVLLIDDDATAPPDWIARHLAHY